MLTAVGDVQTFPFDGMIWNKTRPCFGFYFECPAGRGDMSCRTGLKRIHRNPLKNLPRLRGSPRDSPLPPAGTTFVFDFCERNIVRIGLDSSWASAHFPRNIVRSVTDVAVKSSFFSRNLPFPAFFTELACR